MSMKKRDISGPILVFSLGESRCALLLPTVERVVRAAAVTPLPKAPEIVSGVINVQGRIIPVIDVRRRFRLQERGLRVDDRFIIAHTPTRIVAFSVDSVDGVRARDVREHAETDLTLPFAEYLEGIAKTPDGLILIYDIDAFLSLDEEKMLAQSLSESD